MFNKLCIAACLIMMMACGENQEFEKSESGLSYRFPVKGDGPKPVDGDVLLMNVSYLSGDQVLFSTAEAGGPMPINYDKAILERVGGLEEGFTMLRQGDSLILEFPIEDLIETTFGMQLPDSLVRGSMVTVCIGLENVFTAVEFDVYTREMAAERRKKSLAGNKSKIESDGELIDEFLTENNLTAEVHESGLRYRITAQGSGELAKNGQNVSVTYTGRVLDGRLFDTSVEETAKSEGVYNPGRSYEPYKFRLGTGSVIKGWDIAISLLNPGSKAVIYVPSSLAYGSQQRSAVIGAHEILIFEIELVEAID